MIRHLIRDVVAHFFPFAAARAGYETRPAQRCAKPGCPEGLHYHYGYGQRHWSHTPQTGPNDFSDGRPFTKDSGLCDHNFGYAVYCRLPARHDGQHAPPS